MTLMRWVAVWGAVGTMASIIVGRALMVGMGSEELHEERLQEDTTAPEHAGPLAV